MEYAKISQEKQDDSGTGNIENVEISENFCSSCAFEIPEGIPIMFFRMPGKIIHSLEHSGHLMFFSWETLGKMGSGMYC